MSPTPRKGLGEPVLLVGSHGGLDAPGSGTSVDDRKRNADRLEVEADEDAPPGRSRSDSLESSSRSSESRGSDGGRKRDDGECSGDEDCAVTRPPKGARDIRRGKGQRVLLYVFEGVGFLASRASSSAVPKSPPPTDSNPAYRLLTLTGSCFRSQTKSCCGSGSPMGIRVSTSGTNEQSTSAQVGPLCVVLFLLSTHRVRLNDPTRDQGRIDKRQ